MRRKKVDDSKNDFSTEGSGIGSTVGGYGKVQKPYGLAEWAASTKTIHRFEKKYGNLARQKLSETVKRLQESITSKAVYTPKTLKQIRESIDKGALDSMGTVPKQASLDDPLPETGKIIRRLRNKKHK